jgi:hypothetical protein
MRSKFLAFTALAFVGLVGGLANVAHAADPKNKAAQKKKPTELGGAIDKQLQWEDKVMGPDDKRAELDKIARAQAVNKAAAEKAEREKAERERQAAREAAQPHQPAKKNEVAVPSVADDADAKSKNDKAKPHDISPKLETAEAAAPPPPPKPADDKFIDKLLREESSSRKKAARTDDHDLDALLVGTKPTAKKTKGRNDAVDSLLDAADKGPAMPAPRAKPVVPEWAKPEISSTPTPTPIAARPQPKRDDGIIHVVQGAAAPAMRPVAAPPPPPVSARMTASPSSRRQQAAAPRSAGWTDPFADSGSKRVAARDREGLDAPPMQTTRRIAPPPAPARREPARSSGGGAWNDPFADAPEPRPARRSVPAAATAAPKPVTPKAAPPQPAPRPRWKDPFSDDGSDRSDRGTSSRQSVAMRDPGRAGWGILKKRAK